MSFLEEKLYFHGKLIKMIKVNPILIYIPLQILSLPLLAIGLPVLFYRQILISRKLEVSMTAIEVLKGRFIMDLFEIRKDSSSKQLVYSLQNSSALSLYIILIPLYLTYRITGRNTFFPFPPKPGNESLKDIITSRTIFIDKLIDKHINNVEQFVFLGAGFDTRSIEMLKNKNINIYELDQSTTQTLKKSAANNFYVKSKNVEFIEVDFSHENWHEKLLASNYSPNKKSIFLWEGVTLYLHEQDVIKTFRDIKENSSPGSILIADIYSDSFVSGSYSFLLSLIKPFLKLTNEEFKFGLRITPKPEQSLKNFLLQNSYELGDTTFLGESNKKGPYAAIFEALIK